MRIIIAILLLTNIVSPTWIGKYKKLSEESLAAGEKVVAESKKVLNAAFKAVAMADYHEQRFNHCVEINSRKKREYHVRK